MGLSWLKRDKGGPMQDKAFDVYMRSRNLADTTRAWTSPRVDAVHGLHRGGNRRECSGHSGRQRASRTCVACGSGGPKPVVKEISVQT